MFGLSSIRAINAAAAEKHAADIKAAAGRKAKRERVAASLAAAKASAK